MGVHRDLDDVKVLRIATAHQTTLESSVKRSGLSLSKHNSCASETFPLRVLTHMVIPVDRLFATCSNFSHTANSLLAV